MARDLGIPVLLLSQLNRQPENREDRRPRLSDLRESGAIEQDADVVLFVHRPEYYDANERPGYAELIVAKNRNGRTGKVEMTYHKHCVRFDDGPPLPNFGPAIEVEPF
jgi:replicative DNA helicase